MSQELFQAIFPSFSLTSGVDLAIESDMSFSDMGSVLNEQDYTHSDKEIESDMDLDVDWDSLFYPIIEDIELSSTHTIIEDSHYISTTTTVEDVDVDLCSENNLPSDDVDIDLCQVAVVAENTSIAGNTEKQRPKKYITVQEQLLLEAIAVYEGYAADGSIDWDGVSWHMGRLMNAREAFHHWCTDLSNFMDGSHEIIYPVKTTCTYSSTAMQRYAVPPNLRIDPRSAHITPESISSDSTMSETSRMSHTHNSYRTLKDERLMLAITTNDGLQNKGRIDWNEVAKKVKTADRAQCANRWHNTLRKRHAAWD